VPSLSTKKFLDETSKTYEERLPGSVAEKYLLNRGITNEAMTYFRLGYVGSDPSPGHEFMERRLSIPYITPTGIVQIRFRAIPEDGIPGNPEVSPKMLSVANSGTMLYNTRDLLDSNPTVAICEGEPDTWSARMLGIPAVGIPGAKAWEKIKNVRRAFRFRKVIILADNDDKGEGLELAQTIQADIRNARIILMPEGHDVNSFVRDNGLDALKSMIRK
jgi:DNA primase